MQYLFNMNSCKLSPNRLENPTAAIIRVFSACTRRNLKYRSLPEKKNKIEQSSFNDIEAFSENYVQIRDLGNWQTDWNCVSKHTRVCCTSLLALSLDGKQNVVTICTGTMDKQSTNSWYTSRKSRENALVDVVCRRRCLRTRTCKRWKVEKSTDRGRILNVILNRLIITTRNNDRQRSGRSKITACS